MPAVKRALSVAALVGAVLTVAGFFTFVSIASHGRSKPASRADGIVVLTGGPRRLVEGSKLLSGAWAKRLLISGVNPQTSREELRRLVRGSEDLFDCCVDVGYQAQDTIGNAAETRAWAARWNYRRLIIVTSSYHMPRSLMELSRELPGIVLVPYPVVPHGINDEAWWWNGATIRTLVSEYLKLFPAAARYAAFRLLHPPAAAGQNATASVAGG